MQVILSAIWAASLCITVATATPRFDVTPDPTPAEWQEKGSGETYVLYRTHNVRAMSQGKAGSCVGAAHSKALELQHGIPFSAEWSYGTSRKHFGHNSPSPGSNCAWAAQAGKDVGNLPAYYYISQGVDLTEYSAQRAKQWERGPPVELDWVAGQYRGSGFVHISSWEELRGAIASGHPVIVGSPVGFGSKRGQVLDSRGRLSSKWWSRWPHAMVFCGISDGNSKQALLLNSWGFSWVSGPRWVGDEPAGSFWVSKRDAEKMLSYGDAWAILPIQGLK